MDRVGVSLDICEIGLELKIGESTDEVGLGHVGFEGAAGAKDICIEPAMKC